MKILLLSHIYAPDRSPRAYRWAALAEHWAAEGQQVEVIAGWKPGDLRQEQRGGVIVHRVGGSLVERLRGALLGEPSHRAGPAASAPSARVKRRSAQVAKAIYGATLRRLLWPDYAFHWYPAALRAAETRCRTVGFDAVVSVSHPFTAHLVGLALKRRRPGLRWLADIGDPFSLLVETPLNNKALYGGLNRRAEAAVLRDADGVAVTVERCHSAYAAAFPASADKIATIPPLLSLPAPAAGASWAFPAGINLVCVGTLYRALRDPGPLLALFAALRRHRTDLNLHFFGAIHDCGPCFLPHEAEIGRSIHLHGMVPRETIANVMRAADILVNIGNATAHQLPSKLVEYVASARPILNLASATDDTTAAFLAPYPAALTLRAADCQPDPDAISAALAFIASPPPIDVGEARCFLEPYALAPIAAAYERLLAMTGDRAKGIGCGSTPSLRASARQSVGSQ